MPDELHKWADLITLLMLAAVGWERIRALGAQLTSEQKARRRLEESLRQALASESDNIWVAIGEIRQRASKQGEDLGELRGRLEPR